MNKVRISYYPGHGDRFKSGKVDLLKLKKKINK